VNCIPVDAAAAFDVNGFVNHEFLANMLTGVQPPIRATGARDIPSPLSNGVQKRALIDVQN
jgi:hypothetical protein